MPGTSIRSLSRLLDQTGAVFWVINAAGRLSFLSGGVGDWLGIDPSELLDRQAVAGAPVSAQWQDQLAASLSAPPGITARGTASLRITPPRLPAATQRSAAQSPAGATTGQTSSTLDVRFVQVGRGADVLTFALAGQFDDREASADVVDAIELRRRLDRWRRESISLSAVVSAGESPSARRLRHLLRIASLSRVDVLLVGPKGCGGKSLARGIHQASAPGEPAIDIEGPLMDGELLEATLAASIEQLESSKSATTTAIVRGFDKMPAETQQWLAALHGRLGGRLRLIAIARRHQRLLVEIPEPSSPQHDPVPAALADEQPSGLIAAWMDAFCASVIPVPSIKERVEDVSLLAAAVLDHHRANATAEKRSKDARGANPIPERFSRDALDALAIYPWPGEFSELEHAVLAATRNVSGEVIGAEHLPLAIRSYRPGDSVARAKVASISLDQAVRQFESKLILEAVQAADGNRAEAARRLGISRARLLRKLDDAKPPSNDK